MKKYLDDTGLQHLLGSLSAGNGTNLLTVINDFSGIASVSTPLAIINYGIEGGSWNPLTPDFPIHFDEESVTFRMAESPPRYMPTIYNQIIYVILGAEEGEGWNVILTEEFGYQLLVLHQNEQGTTRRQCLYSWDEIPSDAMGVQISQGWNKIEFAKSNVPIGFTPITIEDVGTITAISLNQSMFLEGVLEFLGESSAPPGLYAKIASKWELVGPAGGNAT